MSLADGPQHTVSITPSSYLMKRSASPTLITLPCQMVILSGVEIRNLDLQEVPLFGDRYLKTHSLLVNFITTFLLIRDDSEFFQTSTSIENLGL
jgi:hypothetical protein